jgi:RNA polymerase sigma-70 factor, ECF subfamily
VSTQCELLEYAQLRSLSDEGLMACLQQGHSDALAQLFDRYHGLVFGVASRILRDNGEAEDIVQAVFLEIFQAASQYDRLKGSARIWILQYAYHRSFNRRRYLILRGFYERTGASGPHREFTSASYGGPLDGVETVKTLQEAFRHLTKTQRDTLELAFYEGLTMREIEQRTGWPVGNVKHHYYRGLEKLRSILCEKSSDRFLNVSPGEFAAQVPSRTISKICRSWNHRATLRAGVLRARRTPAGAGRVIFRNFKCNALD